MQLAALPQRKLTLSGLELDLSQPQIMGILNVTPDSFSDGGQYLKITDAVAHAQQMIAAGASIIDIGGESTRPQAAEVTIDEEIQRVIPVVEALAELNVVLSIDTSQPQVMRAARKAGAHLWNDVRALTRPDALETAAELAIPVILMHMRGEPDTMNDLATYQDVTQEVKSELSQRIALALAAGIKSENIIVDPGFGFAKTSSQNLQLLDQLWQLHDLGYPILSGVSRKRFIGTVVDANSLASRDLASATAHLLSIQQGASIVRTHNVHVMHDCIKMWQAMARKQEQV